MVYGPNPPAYRLFLYGPWATNSFSFLNCLKNQEMNAILWHMKIMYNANWSVYK